MQPQRAWAATLLLLALAAPAAALLGGDPRAPSADRPERRVDPISADSPWAGVGALETGSGLFTATLIDRHHALTAAHVVDNRPASQLRLVLNVEEAGSHRVGIAEVTLHPDYRSLRREKLRDDLAVLRLERPIPQGIPVYPLLQAPIAVGTTLKLVSYGSGGDGIRGGTEPPSAAIRRTGLNAADRLSERDDAGRPRVYTFDFDGRTLASNSLGEGTLGNRLEASLGGGDSGSPAFAYGPAGDWRLAGINTFKWSPDPERDERFGGGGGGVLLAAYREWIEDVVSR